ncbi:lamin tail domain-containing protein [Bacillaceae bacterium Marseille-Q3522]|nr:lamin tail domain-containing protein [Bacillaceae bacterium Marseille-Q3522]
MKLSKSRTFFTSLLIFSIVFSNFFSFVSPIRTYAETAVQPAATNDLETKENTEHTDSEKQAEEISSEETTNSDTGEGEDASQSEQAQTNPETQQSVEGDQSNGTQADPSAQEAEKETQSEATKTESESEVSETAELQEPSTSEGAEATPETVGKETAESPQATVSSELLITEIMPNNSGSDDYEYFEVYNNSDKPIVLDYYTFALRYTDGSPTEDKGMIFAPVTIDSKETLVFWLNHKQKTLADFNSHYSVNLPAEKVVEYDGAPGFYNSGQRAVVISDHGKEIALANYLAEDIDSGLTVQYKYPASGTEMEKYATKAAPTPGTIVSEQVPAEVVAMPENTAPVIDHTPITVAKNSEDVKIQAKITDNQNEFSATLFYQASPEAGFKAISMTLGTESSYEAIIPKAELTSDNLLYLIQAADKNYRTVFPANGQPQLVSINSAPEEEEDFQAYSHLLVTEISPNSEGGGTDYYEYFELYNNTNQPLDLNQYSLIYRYTETGEEKPFQIPETTIEPQEKLVFWFHNSELTLADFNSHFGVNLTADEVVEFKDGFNGFANGGNRAVVIKDNSGTEVIAASYLDGESDNSGAVIQYQYPKSGTEMDKLATMAPPTPGSIESVQVPELPVTLPEQTEDTVAPVINHTPITEAEGYAAITVEADVTDDRAVPIVTLYYKGEKDEQYTSLSMNPDASNPEKYSVTIPNIDVDENLTYYIEVSDGTNVAKTNENTITVDVPTIDYNTLPQFLVTEVVPDSTNVGTADGYEFIEIYNNTDKAINFKDYQINYRYGTDLGSDVVWPAVPDDVVIPAGETLVFWMINAQNGEQTVADFNANYGSNLVENEDIVRIFTGGMANGSMRGITVATNSHKEVSVAYYNDDSNVDDTYADKGIVYQYPVDKSRTQSKIANNVDATPGEVESFQVPKQPVHLEEDTVDPTLENLTAVTEVDQKENINIVVRATDDNEVKTVRLFYKINNQTEFNEVILQEDYNDILYHHTIYSPDLIGNEKVEYYFVTSDGTNEVTSETYEIKITNDLDLSSLRLNVKDGAILAGEKILKGTSEADAPGQVKLSIDGAELTEGTYHSIEQTAYFAIEVNGLNTYFQNAITMGEDVLYLMDDDWLTQWKTFTIPIDPNRLQIGENTITVRSGNKASPFDLESPENRDDYSLRNVRLVLMDGTILRDPDFSDTDTVMGMNDKHPFEDFQFTITDELAHSKTYNWDTTTVVDGEHTITVSDMDEEKNVKVSVDNTAPVVTTNLEEGKEYKGAFEIQVDTVDEIAGVESEKVLLDDEEITVPHNTSSAALAPGEHKLTVQATDKIGNSSELVVHFSVTNENPAKPELVSPADSGSAPVKGDPSLKVKVADPMNDELDVSFYQGFKYDVNLGNYVKAYKNAADIEPPQTMTPEGESAFTSEDISLTSKLDGKYLTTDSSTQFPYHRFDVTVDPSVDENDVVELVWNGNSLEGRKVTMYAWNHSSNEWSIIDYKVAGKEDFKLTGKVAVNDFVKDGKINILIQDEIPSSPEEYDYTFVWMSDTQYYAESYPYIFDRQTEWIAEKQDELKIKYVFHTGDLVNISDQDYQWQNADKFMKVLDDNAIPYGVLAGNHDVDQVSTDYTDYYRYFGEDRFKDKPYYGGSYLNNRGHYDLISAGGNDYIMVYLGWGVTDEGIAWMNDVLAAHPDRKAILNFHEYLLASGSRHPLGDKIYNEVVLPNENVIAVLSGHYHEAQTLVDEIDDNGDGVVDRTVTQMLADYQAGPEGGQGYMRLLHFDQDNNRIIVNTYSPYMNDYNYYDSEAYPGKDEFTIENIDLQPVEKRVATDYFAVNVYTDTEIGKDENVKSGGEAEAVWKGLTENERYSWYAVAEDNYTGKAVSDIWTFTKGENVNPDPDSGEDPGENPDPNPGENPGEDPGKDPTDPENPGDGNQDPNDNQQDQNGSNGANQPGQTNNKGNNGNGNSMPNTATNSYNLFVIGAILIAAGLIVLFVKRRKNIRM